MDNPTDDTQQSKTWPPAPSMSPETLPQRSPFWNWIRSVVRVHLWPHLGLCLVVFGIVWHQIRCPDYHHLGAACHQDLILWRQLIFAVSLIQSGGLISLWKIAVKSSKPRRQADVFGAILATGYLMVSIQDPENLLDVPGNIYNIFNRPIFGCCFPQVANTVNS